MSRRTSPAAKEQPKVQPDLGGINGQWEGPAAGDVPVVIFATHEGQKFRGARAIIEQMPVYRSPFRFDGV